MRLRNTFILVILFSIAMALLESSVVVYIRELLYPEGFGFPLVEMKPMLAITEISREAATIIMLVMVGILAGRTFIQRFAWFIFCFAVWDIFYYVFLKLLIGWPETLLDWDVLFLIPVTWTGPVISPLIVCIYMLYLSVLLLIQSNRGIEIIIRNYEYVLLLTGSVILIIAFTWDYSTYILEHFSFSEIWNLPDSKPLFEVATSYIPRKFNWGLFITGSIPIIYSLVLISNRRK